MSADPSQVPACPFRTFRLRCWARASLYRAGEFSLHEAVDALQSDAGGLVDAIGQDAVQGMLAEAFGGEA
jgi:hypothetical protein